MFGITKTRIRRLKNLTIYGLAIYEILNIVGSCSRATATHGIQKAPYALTRIEYTTKSQSRENKEKARPSFLERKIEDVYLR